MLLSAFPALLSLACAVGLGLFYFQHQKGTITNNETDESDEKISKIHLSDVFQFPLQFWIIAALAMFYYTTIQPFVAVAKPYFKTIYGLSDTESSLIDSFIYIIRFFQLPDCISGCITVLLVEFFRRLLDW